MHLTADFTFLSMEHQALINLAEYCYEDERAHVLRVLKSALYLLKHEGGDVAIVLAAALFFDVDTTFATHLLQSIETYTSETIERICIIINSCKHKESSTIADDNAWCLLHDALLLNTGEALSPKEMYTKTAKLLVKERRSVVRIFPAKTHANS